MTAPPPAAELARRRFAWLTGAALCVILLCAARVRLFWPGVPVVDPDTWGYLHPGLSKLNGQGFIHTNGRNFVYPGFIYLILAATASFRAITLAQHVLGLASGVLLWTCWRQWRAWFTDPRLPLWADALLGLGLVAFFEQSASEVSYEHQIRPEAVFPFFALIEVSLLLAFLRAWFVERRPGRAAGLAGGAWFVALLLYQLKPSFGLALGAAAAPVLVAALVPWRQPGRPRSLLAGAALAATLAGAGLFAWPEHRLAQGDPMSTLFLPETLLTIHADLIADQMAEDLRDHAPTAYDPAWLAQAHALLRTELHRASNLPSHSYPSLGFNPDYLMYRQSFCAWLMGRMTPPQIAAFAMDYYRRVWAHHPGRMLGKIAGQLRVFYSVHCTTFWPGRAIRVDKQYRKSTDAFNYPGYQRELGLYPPARAYLVEARRLGASGIVFPQWPLMVWANVAASVAAWPLLLVFAAEMAFAGLARAGRLRAPPAVASLLRPGWVLLVFYGFVFGNTLTIAIIHSLDVDRYCLNLLVFYAPALVGTLAWLAEFALALTDRREADCAGTGGDSAL